MNERALIQHVVVATDFSPGATAALRRAAWLPLPPGASLSIVHVVPDTIPTDLRDAAAERAMETLRNAAGEAARVASGRALSPKIERAVLVGTPYVEIVRFARSAGADLIVVGRHGARPLRDAFLGSTAERLIRKGDIPILLVNDDPQGVYERALAAIDLSDVSRRVSDLALALLPDEPRELRMVHAYHLPFEGWLKGTTLDDLRRERQHAAIAAAEALAADYSTRGIRCDVSVHEGDPRIVIVREATLARSDLVVVGTHARSGVAHALLGSVAEWIVRSSACDVAVTRPARFTFEMP